MKPAGRLQLAVWPGQSWRQVGGGGTNLIIEMEPRVAIGERVWNETEVAGATNALATAKKAASAARSVTRERGAMVLTCNWGGERELKWSRCESLIRCASIGVASETRYLGSRFMISS